MSQFGKHFLVICKTSRYFIVFSWRFVHLLKASTIFGPVFNIDGTHLYGKFKSALMIAMGCDGNN